MTYPLISAKCITYGRVSTLEESIYSFINQDYPGPKELIIVNDYPLQTLFFDHPEVKIYNLNSTFSTLGEKENYATMLCRGEIICQWDDDDVALPNHLSNVEKYFVPGTEIMHWDRGILVNSGEISAISGLGNSGIVYSKKAWEESGKYPLENAGYDMSFVVQLHRREKVVSAAPPDSEVSWIYYWGNRSYHCSGMGADVPNRPNIIQRHSDYIESERVKGNIPTGNVFLQPKWNINYIQKHRDFIKKKKILVIASHMGGRCGNSIVSQNTKHDVTFICLDDINFSKRQNALHPRLTAKMPKMLAWELYPGYDFYIWIDQMFSIRNPDAIEWFINELGDKDAMFFPHSGRSSIKTELDFVESLMEAGNEYLLSRYAGERMKEQVDEYLKDPKFQDDFLIEAGAFIYKSKIVENKEQNVFKDWFYQNCFYSVQDQLSLPYMLIKHNIDFKLADTNIYNCKYLK
jgi:hypothetical protein